MPLSLSLRVPDRVKIGDKIFALDMLLSGGEFLLRCGDDVFHVVEERYIEIMPEVLVSIGWRRYDGRARLLIDAPRHIRIERLGDPEET
jgi:hypothetical protein